MSSVPFAGGDRGEDRPIDRGGGVVVERDGHAGGHDGRDDAPGQRAEQAGPPRARPRRRRLVRRAAEGGAVRTGGSAEGQAAGTGGCGTCGRSAVSVGGRGPRRQRFGRLVVAFGRLEIGRSHGPILPARRAFATPEPSHSDFPAFLSRFPGTKSGSPSVVLGTPPERQAPRTWTRIRVDGTRALHEHPALHVLPERRRRGGGGPQDLCGLPGQAGVPRARAVQPHRPRRVGRLLRAGASPDPEAPPHATRRWRPAASRAGRWPSRPSARPRRRRWSRP